MANDFSNDSRCKALWRFEDGAFTADSKGTNTLTQIGSPVADTVDYKEGAACVDLERDNSQGFYITDANLDANFPFKTGDINKTGTVCCWLKLESISNQNIWGKLNWISQKLCVLLQLTNNKLRFLWGHGTGYTNNYWDFFTPIAGRWYFVGISIDGITREVQIKVWDQTAGTWSNYFYTASGELRIHDAKWSIGTAESGAVFGDYFDGKIDEVVVFNEFLGNQEIEDIKNGTYSGPIPSIQAYSVGATSAYTLDGRIEANSLGVLAAYSVIPNPPWIDAHGCGLLVAYDAEIPIIVGRVFPVPNALTTWQSQAGKRKFPVVIGAS